MQAWQPCRYWPQPRAVCMTQLCQPHPHVFATSVSSPCYKTMVTIAGSHLRAPCIFSEWGRGAGRRPRSRAAVAPVPLYTLLRPSHHALRASSAPEEDEAVLVFTCLLTSCMRTACFVSPCQYMLLLPLQGVYSFFIYDSNRRSVFAARDPSGREPLYYAMDEDEALRWICGVTNRLCRVCLETSASQLQAS